MPKALESQRFYVYGHFTQDTNELFYVGKGVGQRKDRRNKRNNFWQNIYKKHGLRVEILLDNLNEDEAFYQEYLAVKEYKPRANLVDGGAGFTAQQARAMWENPEYRIKHGQIMIERHKDLAYREKMSVAQSESWKNEESRAVRCENISKALTGRTLAPEHKIKVLKALEEGRKTRYSPEANAKRSAAQKGKKTGPRDPEAVEKTASQLRGRTYTVKSNLARALGHGSKAFEVLDENKNLVGVWINKEECARDLGLCGSNVNRCLNKQRKSHKGYTFNYKD
jgi:hypothetical protein